MSAKVIAKEVISFLKYIEDQAERLRTDAMDRLHTAAEAEVKDFSRPDERAAYLSSELEGALIMALANDGWALKHRDGAAPEYKARQLVYQHRSGTEISGCGPTDLIALLQAWINARKAVPPGVHPDDVTIDTLLEPLPKSAHDSVQDGVDKAQLIDYSNGPYSVANKFKGRDGVVYVNFYSRPRENWPLRLFRLANTK